MKFIRVVDDFLEAMWEEGRINSKLTERGYRDLLTWHGEDVGFRDPRYVGREDIKVTLRRWPNPNTRGPRRGMLVSFYDWMVEEGYRPYNPARQTRRPRRRPATRYRLTLAESIAMLEAAESTRERRAIFMMLCAGLRNRETRLMQRRHFTRPGWVWVSADIAKGPKERWVPVLEDLKPIVEDILAACGPDDFVLPALRMGNPGVNTRMIELPQRGCSQQALGDIVNTVAKRAGIAGNVMPHTLRHAFTDHVARSTGDVRLAQALLGHADISTTQIYMGDPLLDELAVAVKNITFGLRTRVLGVLGSAANPLTPRAGFEPATSSVRAVERILALGFRAESPLRAAVRAAL